MSELLAFKVYRANGLAPLDVVMLPDHLAAIAEKDAVIEKFINFLDYIKSRTADSNVSVSWGRESFIETERKRLGVEVPDA